MKPGKTLISRAAILAGVALLAPLVSMAMSKMPAEQTQGGIAYVSGGIGHDEAEAMRKAQAHYPLSLEFVKHAKPRDEYLADVKVTIEDRAGKTELSTTARGPFLLARVPDGRYTVRAEQHGQVRTRTVSVSAHKPAHLVLEW